MTDAGDRPLPPPPPALSKRAREDMEREYRRKARKNEYIHVREAGRRRSRRQLGLSPRILEQLEDEEEMNDTASPSQTRQLELEPQPEQLEDEETNDTPSPSQTRQPELEPQPDQSIAEEQHQQDDYDEETQISAVPEGDQLPDHGITFDPRTDQRQRYHILRQRGLCYPRHVDFSSFAALGLRDQIMSLIARVGWSTFLSYHEGAHPTPVYEFLSSLSYKRDSVKFRLNNRDHTVTMDTIRHALSLPEGQGDYKKYEYSAISKQFWKTIGCARDVHGRPYLCQYNSSRAKSSMLYNICLRIIQRIMVVCVLIRDGGVGNMQVRELFALQCMLEGRRYNPTKWILDQMLRASNDLGGKNGPIRVGGIVMILLRRLIAIGAIVGTLPTTKPPIPIHFLTLETLVQASIVQPVDGVWWYVHHMHRVYRLPDKEITDPLQPENLLPHPPPAESHTALEPLRETYVIPVPRRPGEHAHIQLSSFSALEGHQQVQGKSSFQAAAASSKTVPATDSQIVSAISSQTVATLQSQVVDPFASQSSLITQTQTQSEEFVHIEDSRIPDRQDQFEQERNPPIPLLDTNIQIAQLHSVMEDQSRRLAEFERRQVERDQRAEDYYAQQRAQAELQSQQITQQGQYIQQLVEWRGGTDDQIALMAQNVTQTSTQLQSLIQLFQGVPPALQSQTPPIQIQTQASPVQSHGLISSQIVAVIGLSAQSQGAQSSAARAYQHSLAPAQQPSTSSAQTTSAASQTE